MKILSIILMFIGSIFGAVGGINLIQEPGLFNLVIFLAGFLLSMIGALHISHLQELQAIKEGL